MYFRSINPSTGLPLALYKAHSKQEILQRVSKANRAFRSWRSIPPVKRAKVLYSLARELRRSRMESAELIVNEMGKPIQQALAEIEKCAINCEFYAKQGPQFLLDERPVDSPPNRYFFYQPMGVVLAIMPWNFPFWQVFRFAAPALMAGNSLLLKHATNVCGCALAIERIFARSGAPNEIFQILLTDGKRASALLPDGRISMVTMTGSSESGRKVAALAGAAMKKGVFELGGSDPYLVLADANLSEAARICAASRLYNNGQSCIAAKRFIVVDKIRSRFEHLFVKEMDQDHFKDPMAHDCKLGALAHGGLQQKLHQQVLKSVKAGASLLLGGKLPHGPGSYYPPTVLTNVGPGMPAYDEELFGPVAAIIPAKNASVAIRIANDNSYGLGGAIFTQNRRRGERIARDHLECGNAFVNEGVRSHPSLPFGGVKQSGYGRELGAQGLREFMNTKTISIS